MREDYLRYEQCIRFLLLACCCICAIAGAYAQVERTYKPRQVIELGEGRKVEIVRCRGEGPLEECDVIYYTTRRQDGVRMWQNTNRLREEEYAATLAKSRQETHTAGMVNKTLMAMPERQKVLSDTVVKMAVKKYQKTTAELESVTRKADSASPAAINARQLTLQKAAKKLDSTSKAVTDTFKLSLQRELEMRDSLEKIQEKNTEPKKQDTTLGAAKIKLAKNEQNMAEFMYRVRVTLPSRQGSFRLFQGLVISELLTKTQCPSTINYNNLRQKANFAVLL